MDPVTAFLSFAVLLVTIGYWLMPKRPKNFPPGPTGIPLFGAAFSLGPQGYRPALELGKKYGSKIIGLTSGSHKVVYLNDVEDIREALSKSEFSGRGFNPLLDVNPDDCNSGVIMSRGSTWMEQRRFTLRTLRDFGFGKRSLETIIQEEVDGLMEEFKKTVGTPISTAARFNISAINVIWSIVAGQRFSLDDPKLQELINLLNDFFKTSFDGMMFFSFLFPAVADFRKKYPFLFSGTRNTFRQKVFDFLRSNIKEHRLTMTPGNPPRDFIDAYLEEQKKNENNPNSSFKHEEDDFSVIVTLFDLFVAGGETTSTSMCFAFFILAYHPEIQEKMHKEIIAAGATDRPVALADRPNLTYNEAVISELFRFSTITPIAIPHGVTEDTTFRGFNIPKGTLVIPNIWAAHFDEKIWGDPHVFRPERFIKEESDGSLKLLKNSALMPFSVGKRECLGASLAKDEFFLFLTNSIRNFTITVPADEPKHTFNGRFGLVNTPEPHRVILHTRQ